MWWSKRDGLSCEKSDGGGGLGDEGAAHICYTFDWSSEMCVSCCEEDDG